jgi:polysaccharide biosynthesis protein PslG
VLKLDRAYILFDLNTRPAASDRLYFLESGHTLGGVFRAFWERNGGVLKLGYPLSEELEEANPLDGQVRTVQYFERAVLERHKEFAGTPDEVMPAAVGRWVTLGRNFQRVEPFTGTEARWYFADTGHSVKQAFLRYWQKEGGVAVFGYPISEELPEINPADGKVYTVQYFERARFEWHPTFAGTPDEVQLGLIGKQALEMPRR